jgi:hypothetical protein
MHAAPLRVGILPADEYKRRRRLWSALEDAYPVHFEGCEHGTAEGLDALVAIGSASRRGEEGGNGGGEGDSGGGNRDGRGESPRGDIPCLLAEGEEQADPAGDSPRALVFSHDAALARPLHGAQLGEAHCAASLVQAVPEREVVLASLDGTPVWTRAQVGAHPAQRVACAPAELKEGEALRERLQPGRCLALLALAQFLDHLETDGRRAERPLHATFLIDDPNLHRPSYGHLRYRELLRDAHANGYHLSIAMVPLDGWFADPRVARMFREGAAQLSVCVHGNEHYGPELAGPRSVEEGVALGMRALRRVAAFEARTGVAVDRVMVPPHERIGEPMTRALLACGFQALCTTRPYPWMVNSPDLPWLTRPAEAGPLAAWRPVDVVAGGLPVLLRADFALHPREDLVLRAFLGQPLILYGHHELLHGGPGALADTKASLDRLGDVRWSSLAEIARASIARLAPRSDPPDQTAAGPGARPSSTAKPPEGSAGGMEPDPATIALQPRRLRPILRRVAAEAEVRTRAALASRAGRR